MNTSLSHSTSNSHNSSLHYSLLPCPSPAKSLMESHMNVIKLVEIKSGLKWHNYRGKPLGSSLPGESGVLLSFSRCLSAGLACCYQAIQFRAIDGPLQNATRLVVFSFNQEHLDVASKIDSSLIHEGTGDADDGLTEEVKKLLDLAIQNLIERMLHSEGYITLGTWFARPDPSTESLFLYRLNYFNQESSYWVCAALSVMEVSACLRAFSSAELCQVESLKGRKVVLSPCGLSGQLTGRSYTEETQGSVDILSEWERVYPNMFLSPAAPPLLEVMIAGVCMKYPTQFLLFYSAQEHSSSQRQKNRENSHQSLSVKNLIDGVYNLDMQSCGSEYLPFNRVNMDFRIASTSSGRDTPSHLIQDRRCSIAPASSPLLIRVKSSDVMDLTSHSSTPVLGVSSVTDVVFSGDRKKPTANMPRPPKDLKILKQESMHEDRLAWQSKSDSNLQDTRVKNDSSGLWASYTLPDSLTSLESLYSSQECVLEYGYSGLQHPGVRMGTMGKAQVIKNKKGRSRTRSEKSSASRTPTSRKKRLSKSESKKQQTPTGREDKPMDLTLPDKEMTPHMPGYSGIIVTPTSSQSTCSAFNMPPDMHCNDVTEMRAPVLDVLVPTPTTSNTQFNMPEPSSVFTPGPYTHGGLTSPSTESTPQHSALSGQHKHSIFPGPPSAHGTFKNQMPEQIFETDDEDSATIDSSQMHFMESKDVDVNKHNSNLYTKNPNILMLEDAHSILTPPSIGKSGQSPVGGKMKTLHSLDRELFELVPDSFSPNYGLELDMYKQNSLGRYNLSYEESTKQKLSLCRDNSLMNDNAGSNTDDIRSISSGRGMIETACSSDTGLLSNTPSTLPLLNKSVSESNSVKKDSTETLRRPLSNQATLPTLSETQQKTTYPEIHALLMNFMLLDPQQALPEQIQTPFPTPHTAHTSQPNHFTFPPSYVSPDELSFSLDALLTYGTSRDLTLHTLEFYEDRHVGNFPVHYFHTYDQLVAPHPAESGWNQVGYSEKPRIPFTPKRIQFEPLPVETTPLIREHPRTLSLTLELIQRHCLSSSAPLTTHPSCKPVSRSNGVIDLYERGTLANTLRQCYRFYADYVDEEDTMMDLSASVDMGSNHLVKETSSPATATTITTTTNTLDASQSETEGENQGSEDGQTEDEDEATLLELDFSLDIDNDGSWLTTLKQSSDNTTVKLIKKFQSSLPKSMLRRSPSPLTWSELFQILSPVQQDTRYHTPSIPSPLPVPALLVGQESDWVEISPYDVINWDKLSLCPYGPREDINFLVVSPVGEKLEHRVSHYFKQLSQVYQDSELGRHRPVPQTNSRSDGIYTYTPAHSTSSLYLDTDSLSIFKHLLMSHVLTQLAAMSSQDKQRRDTELFQNTIPQHNYNLHSSNPISETERPPSVVLYILNTGAPHQQIDIMRVFAEALVEHPISPELCKRIILCVIPAQDVVTQRRLSSQSLRAICMDVFSKCRYFSKSWMPSRGMNFVEDCDDWRAMLYQDKSPQPSMAPQTVWMYRPPYILAKPLVMRPDPTPPSMTSHPPANTTNPNLTDFQLGQRKSNTLFCGYCVSTGNSYLLVVCCDSQGSLLDSAVLGLRYPGKTEGGINREAALRDMWRYILSILSQTVLSWHVVITRLGRPSNEELSKLKQIVRDLGSVQVELTKGCSSCGCKCNTHVVSIQSVHVLSFQPEKNFRALLNVNTTPVDSQSNSSTYILVQPGPNYLDTYTQMDELDLKDNYGFFIEMPATGQLQSADEGMDEMNIFKEMDGIDGLGLPTPGALADEVDNYHAVGYVLSSAEPGPLPAAFWGDKSERNAFFRAQLHGQFYLDTGVEPRPKHLSYEESLKKILEQFDALSWLVLSAENGGRVSALPLHLYTLCNIYHMVRWLNTKRI